MKKSQVVATLAAASVMGAVAPLAQTASAFNVTNDQTVPATGEAECWELNKVVENVKKDSQYDWFVNRANVLTKYGTGAGKEYADITNGAQYQNAFNTLPWATAGTITGQAEIDFKAEVNALKDSVNNIINNGTPADATDDVSVNSIKFVKEAGALIENDSYRKAFSGLITALNSNSGVVAAINAFRISGVPEATTMTGATKADGTTTFTADEMADPDMLPAIYTIANLNKVYGANTVSFYSGLDSALAALKPELTAAEDGKEAFEDLLNQDVLTDTARADYEAADKDTDAKVVYKLKNIANTTANLTTEMQAWEGIYTDLTANAANFACTDNTPRSDIFDDIWTLATEYKAGEGRGTEKTEAIARELIDGTQPGDGDNKPGEDDDNKPGEDDDKKPSEDGNKPSNPDAADKNNTSAAGTINTAKGKGGTPNTGVAMATAEGTTAKSTGIVATLISAIAAAGVGLTALRRNKKNA